MTLEFRDADKTFDPNTVYDTMTAAAPRASTCGSIERAQGSVAYLTVDNRAKLNTLDPRADARFIAAVEALVDARRLARAGSDAARATRPSSAAPTLRKWRRSIATARAISSRSFTAPAIACGAVRCR